MFDLIPTDRRAIARAALTATFGARPLDSLQPITTGISALIYRIEVSGRPYLLRLESSMRDEVRDPARAYHCMQVAAEEGIAPRLIHADAASGAAIMDFVQGCSLNDHPGGVGARAHDLGTLIARLQATPVFPPVDDYSTVLAGMFDRLIASGGFAAGLLEPHREGFERIREAYAWEHRAMVSSHNDPHPGNIIFDGARLWLIDWETAYRNDPLLDVAILTMYLASTAELEDVLLRSWLGHAPGRLLRARLLVMRQMARLFYACSSGLHVATAMAGAAPETDLAAPKVAEYVAAIEQGRLVEGSVEAQRVGGKLAFRMFLAGLTAPGFAEALAVVRQG